MKITCGIYTITNSVNGKQYAGSSRDYRKRKNFHLSGLRRGCHANKHLQASFSKHGEDAFKWNLELEVYEPFLLWIEQVYLSAGGYEYNIATEAAKPPSARTPEHRAKIGAAHRGKKLTEAQKNRLREVNIGKKYSAETRAKVSAAGRGRISSAETRAKLSAAKKGVAPYIPTNQTRERMRIAQTGRKHPPETIAKMRESAKRRCRNNSGRFE